MLSRIQRDGVSMVGINNEINIITNRVLYGMLAIYFESYSAAAKAIGVKTAILNHAVVVGSIPEEDDLLKICKYFKIPEHILFNKDDISRCSKNVYGMISKTLEFKSKVSASSYTSVKIERPVFLALLIAENIKIVEIADRLKVSERTIQNWIYSIVEPRYQKMYTRLEKLLSCSIDHILYQVQ